MILKCEQLIMSFEFPKLVPKGDSSQCDKVKWRHSGKGKRHSSRRIFRIPKMSPLGWLAHLAQTTALFMWPWLWIQPPEINYFQHLSDAYIWVDVFPKTEICRNVNMLDCLEPCLYICLCPFVIRPMAMFISEILEH